MKLHISKFLTNRSRNLNVAAKGTTKLDDMIEALPNKYDEPAPAPVEVQEVPKVEVKAESLEAPERELEQQQPSYVRKRARYRRAPSYQVEPALYANEDSDAARHSPIFFQEHKERGSQEFGDQESLEGRENIEPQDYRHSFLRGREKEAGSLLKARSEFSVMQGTLIPAVLLTTVNSDLPGPISARITENLHDTKTGRNLVIPQGSTLINEYSSTIARGQNRAQIVWTRIIFPNTESVMLGRMPGVDKLGATGVRGQVDNHWDQVAASAVLSTLLSAGYSMSQGNSRHHESSPAQQVGQAMAQNVHQLGSKIIDRSLDIQPIITVNTGTKINVFVMQDLSLKAYQK